MGPLHTPLYEGNCETNNLIMAIKTHFFAFMLPNLCEMIKPSKLCGVRLLGVSHQCIHKCCQMHEVVEEVALDFIVFVQLYSNTAVFIDTIS